MNCLFCLLLLIINFNRIKHVAMLAFLLRFHSTTWLRFSTDFGTLSYLVNCSNWSRSKLYWSVQLSSVSGERLNLASWYWTARAEVHWYINGAAPIVTTRFSTWHRYFIRWKLPGRNLLFPNPLLVSKCSCVVKPSGSQEEEAVQSCPFSPHVFSDSAF